MVRLSEVWAGLWLSELGVSRRQDSRIKDLGLTLHTAVNAQRRIVLRYTIANVQAELPFLVRLDPALKHGRRHGDGLNVCCATRWRARYPAQGNTATTKRKQRKEEASNACQAQPFDESFSRCCSRSASDTRPGLEWDAPLLPAATSGTLPHIRSLILASPSLHAIRLCILDKCNRFTMRLQ